jgi:hypothetical protein
MPRQISDSSKPLSVVYAAHFDPDQKRFTVFANGLNLTTSYRTFLEVDPEMILPAIVDFVNIKPTGVVGQLVTPFSVQLTLVAASVLGEAQRTVTVHDLDGPHQIPIELSPGP